MPKPVIISASGGPVIKGHVHFLVQNPTAFAGVLGVRWGGFDYRSPVTGADLVRSPWGGFCDKLPDGDSINDLFISSHVRNPEFYQDPLGISNWSGELTDEEQFKCEAAVGLLTSLPSNLFFIKLIDNLYPASYTLNEDNDSLIDKICSSSTALDVVVRRVRYRFRDALADRAEPGREGTEDDPLTLAELVEAEEDPSILKMNDSPILIGLNRETNPFYKLLYSEGTFLSVRTSKLTSGTDTPGSFAFPLNWATAVNLCIGGDSVPLTLSASQRAALRTLGETLVDKTKTSSQILAAIRYLKTAFGELGLFTAPTVGVGATFLRHMAADALTAIGEAISAAGGEDATLNDIAAELLWGLYLLHEVTDEQLDKLYSLLSIIVSYISILPAVWLISDSLKALKDALDDLREAVNDDNGRFLLGLSGDEIASIVYSLYTVRSRTDDMPDLPTSLSLLRKPMVHLDPALFRFPMSRRSGAYTGNDETWWQWFDTNVNIFEGWFDVAGPTLQFAYTLELASVILEQTFNQESAFLALSGLVGDEGLIGNFARQQTGASAIGTVSEIIGDVPVSRLIRYLWRQVMADYFISLLNAEATCIYEIFCWMRREDDRNLLDAVLGRIGEGGSRSFDGLIGDLLDLVAKEGSLAKAWAAMDCTSREQIQQLVKLWDKSCINEWADLAPVTPEDDSFDVRDVDLIDFSDLYKPIQVDIITDRVWDQYVYEPWRDVTRHPWNATDIAQRIDLVTSLQSQGYQLNTLLFGASQGWIVRRGP